MSIMSANDGPIDGRDDTTQYSAGGVAFRSNGGEIEIALILTNNERRWQLPKGHLDPGETAEQAALREVAEEAGIECDLLEPILEIKYRFTHHGKNGPLRILKFVNFYLMRYVSGDVADHDDEVAEARWLPIDEALKTLYHEDEKRVVTAANEILKGSYA